MKLLIAEDEEYALRGLLDRLDLATLGISEVETAADGQEALDKAARFLPDIVLTDVRMPHLDGVSMVRRLRETNPDLKVIFVSGYADKAYLKSAIELGAVRYIEKPAQMSEIRGAIRSAADQLQAERVRTAVIGATMASLEAELAARLAETPCLVPEVERLIELTGFRLTTASRIVSVLFRIGPGAEDAVDLSDADVEDFVRYLRARCARSPFTAFITPRPQRTVLAHLTTRGESGSLVTETEVAQFISRVLTGPGAPWRAAAGIGASVRGWPAIGESVRTAGSALDHAFFGEYARAFRYTETTDEPRRIGDDVVAEYARMLDAADEGSATGVISALTESLCRPPHPSAAEARRLYRKLLLRLMLFRDEKGIQSPRLDRLGALWANIEAGGNAADIGRVLTEGTAELLSRIEETREHGRVVSEIKRYIMENFRDPAICIDVIAQAVSLSPAYACTRFKAVTGKTINGYLTEVRVSRAKEMLADPNGPRISEVAQRVGWPNADYFARVFRKATSRSPSEFREHTPSDSGD